MTLDLGTRLTLDEFREKALAQPIREYLFAKARIDEANKELRQIEVEMTNALGADYAQKLKMLLEEMHRTMSMMTMTDWRRRYAPFSNVLPKTDYEDEQ
jgi:hypothetical protein